MVRTKKVEKESYHVGKKKKDRGEVGLSLHLLLDIMIVLGLVKVSESRSLLTPLKGPVVKPRHPWSYPSSDRVYLIGSCCISFIENYH